MIEISNNLPADDDKTCTHRHAFPCFTSGVEEAELSSSVVTSLITDESDNSYAAPITFDAPARTPSSSWNNISFPASSAEGTLIGNFAFFPPYLITMASASRVAVCTTTKPASESSEDTAPLPNDVETNSLIRGSSLVDRGMRSLNALMASKRTCLEGSESALRKVVWNCGTNARSAGPPFDKMSPKVLMMAIFTAAGFLSPTIRSSGPVTLIMNGPARNLVDVMDINSPRPAAAASRVSWSPYRIPR
mmetsp:Transcript_13856/g.20286  ORF Transcript_13856/g.20286 Transcript_13856/m.20286 type:complete len:248 (-) Transcript_13856:326-1069(-)